MKAAKKYVLLISASALLICAALLLPGLTYSLLPQANAVRVTGESISDTLECTGTIEAKTSKNLYTATGLMVDTVYVENGQRVKAGDPLFSVDRSATVSLWIAAGDSDASESEEVSKLLDGLLNDYFSDAVSNIFSSFSETTEPDNGSATSELIVLVPDIVTASTDGIVANIAVENGSYADSSSPLLQICDTSDMFVRAELSESFASELCEGQNCTVTGDAFKDTYTATLTAISPVAKTASVGKSSVTCLAEIDFPDNRIKAGYTADLTIELSKKSSALLVPYSAILQDDDGTEYVWILYASRTYRHNITTGIELDDRVEITSGIDPGSLIVTNPSSGMREGCRVRIIED